MLTIVCGSGQRVSCVVHAASLVWGARLLGGRRSPHGSVAWCGVVVWTRCVRVPPRIVSSHSQVRQPAEAALATSPRSAWRRRPCIECMPRGERATRDITPYEVSRGERVVCDAVWARRHQSRCMSQYAVSECVSVGRSVTCDRDAARRAGHVCRSISEVAPETLCEQVT